MLPLVPVKMSLCLWLRFTSANDSAGPVGLTTARRWGPSEKRFTARSALQTVPCCLHQNSSSADSTAQRKPRAPQPTFMSPQGNPQLCTNTQTALLYTTPTSHHNQPHSSVTLRKQTEVLVQSSLHSNSHLFTILKHYPLGPASASKIAAKSFLSSPTLLHHFSPSINLHMCPPGPPGISAAEYSLLLNCFLPRCKKKTKSILEK